MIGHRDSKQIEYLETKPAPLKNLIHMGCILRCDGFAAKTNKKNTHTNNAYTATSYLVSVESLSVSDMLSICGKCDRNAMTSSAK